MSSACKLVKKITAGEVVEMSKLLPDRLASSGDNELTKASKKQRVVTDVGFLIQPYWPCCCCCCSTGDPEKSTNYVIPIFLVKIPGDSSFIQEPKM